MAVRLVCNQLIQEPALEAAIVAFAEEALRQMAVQGREASSGAQAGAGGSPAWSQQEALRCVWG